MPPEAAKGLALPCTGTYPLPAALDWIRRGEVMAMPAKVSGSDDPKTMVITPNTPLTAGTYQVQWRAVSSDTHPITGNVTFKVK